MRKSQSGMNAAMLVAIIGALIVLYIIFLPSEKRLEVIGENDTEENGDGNEEKILAEDKEIIMEHIGEDEIEHEMPSINLYSKTEAKVLKEENSIYVKNGLFEKEGKEIAFSVSEQNIKNAIISFDAKRSKGRLIIKLNDNEIFNKEVNVGNVGPLKIDTGLISSNNKVVIETSGVGFAFWRTNEFLLENFKVTADVTDVSTREATITFTIPQTESRNIEQTEMRFVAECKPQNVGILDISVNGHVIYSSVPDCGIPRNIEFSPVNMITGENKLNFKTNKGTFLIDQIKITTKLRDQPSYTYFFDIDSDDFNDIQKGTKHVNLTFFFVDDKEEKEAEIAINSRKTFMTRHNEFEWSKIIDGFVEEGTNSLKIIPEIRMEVRKLQVTLED